MEHALRLGIQGVELLETGRISLPVAEPDLSFLRSVRRGEVALDDAIAAIDDYEARLLALRSAADVPPEPDRAWVDGWLHRSYEAFWATLAGRPATG